MAGPFEYRQARDVAGVFARHGVRYLFIGKSGAILLGYPDTTQDADGIETFAAADNRGLTVEGIRVCHLDGIIRSKEAAGRVKDRESLPRLRAFHDWWIQRRRGDAPSTRS